MPVNKPFLRTCRQFRNGTYGGAPVYILDPRFAREPRHYIRAFELIQKDLFEVFEYIEPADTNLDCFSYRVHALHMRACIEVEANCKAVLSENGYAKSSDWNMADYRKLEATHLLSGYHVELPEWRGTQSARTPFATWATGGSLPWYAAYNVAKHNRHDQFSQASFRNLVDAVSGLVALLSAQFFTWDFSPSAPTLALDGFGGPPPGLASAIGGYFHVRFPNWPAGDQYDFDWDTLQADPDPFQRHAY